MVIHSMSAASPIHGWTPAKSKPQPRISVIKYTHVNTTSSTKVGDLKKVSATAKTAKVTLNESPSASKLLDLLFDAKNTSKDKEGSSTGCMAPWRSRSLPKSFFNPPIATRCPISIENKGGKAEAPLLKGGKRRLPKPVTKRSKSVTLMEYRVGSFKPIKEEDSKEMIKSPRSVTPKTPQCGKRSSPHSNLIPVKPKKRSRPLPSTDKNYSLVPPSFDKKFLNFEHTDTLSLIPDDSILNKLGEFEDSEPVESFKWRDNETDSTCSTPIDFGGTLNMVTPTTFDEVSEELNQIESDNVFMPVDPVDTKRTYSCPDLSSELSSFRIFASPDFDEVLSPGITGDVFGDDEMPFPTHLKV